MTTDRKCRTVRNTPFLRLNQPPVSHPGQSSRRREGAGRAEGKEGVQRARGGEGGTPLHTSTVHECIDRFKGTMV